ncbi:glutaminyl-peptide cyclotransferase [Rhodococcus sp. EPR-157]|uniref:glutaminyl-peptide cyclotransferase n=1 Tax=Rhodococcus sp. EPR-157 TaxID=1813677 RepID=UPI0007BB7617|nr:glutaminyl-peptide cyclotransferase [Rhodococcus sp. EPR-157]KZF03368.1 glutaminyl-peptide cyclotransferase [Rhodococcus sp. EPR-157]
MSASFRILLGLVASTALLVGCTSSTPAATDTSVPDLSVSVVRTLPHDRTAFTQGLEVSDGQLYESTGRNGSSYITVSDLDTGAELRRVDLSADYFGEGFTVAGDTAWQITWQDGVAFARDPQTLVELRRVEYDGEGWGLCESTDAGLVMSDGSSTLAFRDPVTFEVTSTVEVTSNGQPVANLNELECAEDGSVYANVWRTYDIARIDPKTGDVTAMIDARPLWDAMTNDERAGADVLNGIAQIPGTDRFLVTGKLWPTMYEVEFTASQ